MAVNESAVTYYLTVEHYASDTQDFTVKVYTPEGIEKFQGAESVITREALAMLCHWKCRDLISQQKFYALSSQIVREIKQLKAG